MTIFIPNDDVILNPNAGIPIEELPYRRRSGKALVLTGGGAMGAFQVGALKELYLSGYRPDIICGVSVGAINAAKLAEGEGAIDELETLWHGLAQGNLHITDEFAGVTEFKRRLTDWLTGVGAAASGLAALPPVVDVAAVAGRLATASSEAPHEAIRDAQGLHALGSVGDGVPNGFSGLRELIRGNINPDRIRNSEIKLRIGMVDLESGSMWQATEPQLVDWPDIKGVGTPTWSSRLDRDPDLFRDSSIQDYRRWIRIEDAIYASTVMPVYFPPLVAQERMASNGDRYIDTSLPVDFMTFLAQHSLTGSGSNGWRHFFDGGLADIVPIRTAMRLGAREITVVGVSPLHFSSWSYERPDGVDFAKTPAFQYLAGFLDTWGLNVARSDMMLALAANEFGGWLYRLQAMMPPELAVRAREEFQAYARTQRGVISNLLGNMTWFGGSVPMDRSSDTGLNQPFYDEACTIRVVTPIESLPLTATQFTNAEGIARARDIGARRMQYLLNQPADMILSNPVPEEEILSSSRARQLGIVAH